MLGSHQVTPDGLDGQLELLIAAELKNGAKVKLVPPK
jgi:hypothetical protein